MKTTPNPDSGPLPWWRWAPCSAACSGGKEQGVAPGAGAAAGTRGDGDDGRQRQRADGHQLPGRTTPYLIAELRPQVTGILTQRAFDEGQRGQGRAGSTASIDAPYQAAHDSAKAALARAEANAQVARIKAERHAGLVKIDAVSKQANDDAQAALKQAQAEVAAAKAALDKARIDLDYTRLKSPIAGRIGRSAVTPGALVTANQAQALATVQQLDPIYVDLTQSSADMLRLRAEIAAGRPAGGREGEVPVKLILEDGSEYPVEGRLALSEVTVDEGTGSVTLRARFANADGVLLPGMYVRPPAAGHAQRGHPGAAQGAVARPARQRAGDGGECREQGRGASGAGGAIARFGLGGDRRPRRPASASSSKACRRSPGCAGAGAGGRARRPPPDRPPPRPAERKPTMARFFIDRPIFAWVIAIVIMLAGACPSAAAGVPVPVDRTAGDRHQRQYPAPPPRRWKTR